MPNTKKLNSNQPVAKRYPTLPFEITKGVHFTKVHFEERKTDPAATPERRKPEKLPVALPPLRVRRLKVTERYVDHSRKTMSLYSPARRVSQIPQIKLSGKWLEEAGFLMRSSVEVFVSNNLLVIKPID